MQDKWITRMEKVTANAVWRALQKQKRELQETFKRLGIPDDGMLKVIIATSGKPVVDGFIERAKTTIKRWYSDIEKQWPTALGGLDFNIPAKKESVYLQALKDLHLSQAKGSITNTTEERVKKLVTSGIKEGLSAKEIAKNIEKLDPQVFSKNRADLIAINQIGKAKQFGEHLAVKEYDNMWYLTLKYWSTVNDRRVTRTHTANQNDWWIGIDETFSWTWDLVPPASDNPRCRCACLYKIWELKGSKQPNEIEQMLEARENTKKHEDFKKIIKLAYEKEYDVNTNMWVDDWDNNKDLVKLKIQFPELTKEEIIAWWLYTGNIHQQVNQILRSKVIDPYHIGTILNLESMLNALPIYNWDVWRWIDGDKISWKEVIEVIKNLKEWEIFFDAGFVSTSTKKSTAEDFAKKDGIVLKILDAKWHDVSKFSKLTEDEILLNNGKNLLFLWKSGNIFLFKQI